MISSLDMRRLEKEAEEKGITPLQMMENAGSNAARIVNELLPLAGRNVLVFAGLGNNGGDGFCFARHAHAFGANVSIFLVRKASEIKTAEALKNFEILRNYKFRIFEGDIPEGEIKKADILIDALLGTGLKGTVHEAYRAAIEKINNAGDLKFKVSIDCPSGIDTDTGEIMGAAVRPDATICLHDIKKGLRAENSGNIKVASIGLPEND